MLGFSPLSSQPLAATETPSLPSLLLTATLGVLVVGVNTSQSLSAPAELQASVGTVNVFSASALPVDSVEAVASVGTVDAQASATVVVSPGGQEISTSFGNVVVFNEDTVLISGASATGTAGFIGISGDANFAVAGAQSSTFIGTTEVSLGAIAPIALQRILARLGTAAVITTEGTIDPDSYSRLRTIYIREPNRSNVVYVRGR